MQLHQVVSVNVVDPVLAQCCNMTMTATLTGPENSGKREIIKAFATMLAYPYIAFNCSVGMPYQSFGTKRNGLIVKIDF